VPVVDKVDPLGARDHLESNKWICAHKSYGGIAGFALNAGRGFVARPHPCVRRRLITTSPEADRNASIPDDLIVATG
jgi:hypothetical protein